tara:strand:- start:200 stop:460 length:261 start_codon:yes stop_codon:yes gene_type:complete
MSPEITKDDPIWELFIKYCRLIDAEATNASLDIYGTEQKSNMALKLTEMKIQDHGWEKVVGKLQDLEKQKADHARISRYKQGTVDA